MENIIPLTIQISTASNSPISRVVIGSNNDNFIKPNSSNTYYFMVVDRTDLKVVEVFSNDSDNHSVPAQLTPYKNNPKYMLIMISQAIVGGFLPTGDFHSYLKELGAGVALQKIEQMWTALSSSTWGFFAYAIVAVMDGSISFDFSEYKGASAFTLQLIPVPSPNEDGVLYTPAQLE